MDNNKSEKKQNQFELTTSVLQNRIIVDKIWSNYQYSDTQMMQLTGISQYTIMKYSRGERDYKLSDLVSIMQQLGCRVVIEAEDGRIDYTPVDHTTAATDKRRYKYRSEPTRAEVFQQLQKWYGDFNQTKMGEILGITQAAIAGYLRKK